MNKQQADLFWHNQLQQILIPGTTVQDFNIHHIDEEFQKRLQLSLDRQQKILSQKKIRPQLLSQVVNI